jgi:probable HAF family extracellular repeat protein
MVVAVVSQFDTFFPFAAQGRTRMSFSFLGKSTFGLFTASLLLASSTAVLADSFQSLGVASGGNFSNVQGMDASGNAVVGDIGYPIQAGRWTSSTGWVGLGYLPSSSSVTEGLGVSSDGTAVVGYDGLGGCGNNRAFKWTSTTGMVALGSAPGANYSLAYGANSDGSVVVGDSAVCGGGNRAARWTASTGWADLGVLPGQYYSQGLRANSDGSVVIGNSGDAANVMSHGFIWTASQGMQDIGFLPGGSDTRVGDITPDGTMIVGRANDSTGQFQAFAWTASTGMVSLGQLPGGGYAAANDVSANGSVVVGVGNDSNGTQQAVRWTPGLGMQSIQDLLTAAGVSTAGWQLQEARGVSANGKIISGNGIDPNGVSVGWIANISLPLQYTFIGFNNPLENLPFSNSSKAGSAIPVKWQLTDGDGNFVSDLSVVESLQYAPVACDSQDVNFENPIDAEASGGSGLQYDSTTNEFVYPWKTLKSQKNSCAVFALTLTDGQQHFARFWLK